MNNLFYILKLFVGFLILFQVVIISYFCFNQSRFLLSIQNSSSYYIKYLVSNLNLNLYDEREKASYDPLEEFKMIHKDIIENKTRPIRVTISGYSWGGYANKMYCVLSSMVIAILTDSALLIRWNDIDKYIQEPLHRTFINRDLEQNEFSAVYRSHELVRPKTKYAWKSDKNVTNLIATQLPANRTRFVFNQYIAYFFELCSNPIYYDKLLHYGLVSQKTIEKSLHAIKLNGSMSNKEKLNEILQVGFEVGGNLLNKMWIPKESILNLMQFYLDNHFKDSYVIGIQIRQIYINVKEDLEVFISCAKQIEESNSNKTVKWFVSSESSAIIDQFIKKFTRDKIIVANGTIGHIESNKNAYERAILDNELLSKCDEIIITGGSTFGFLASIRKLKLPYYVNGGRKVKECLRAELSYPSETPGGASIFRK